MTVLCYIEGYSQQLNQLATGSCKAHLFSTKSGPYRAVTRRRDSWSRVPKLRSLETRQPVQSSYTAGAYTNRPTLGDNLVVQVTYNLTSDWGESCFDL